MAGQKQWPPLIFVVFIASLALVSAVIFVAGLKMNTNTPRFAVDTSNAITPMRSMSITVPKDVRDRYLAELTKFATANNFQIRIARLHPTTELFGADLLREDIWIYSHSVLDPLVFDTSFYPIPGNPPPPQSVVDSSARKFKELISQIPGVTIKDIK
jgi:hypothetical protein